MPIDASIIGGLRPQAPIEITDPVTSYAKAAQLKALMGQGQLQDMQMRQAQQGLDDDAAVRSAYQQSGGDSVKLRQLLNQGGQYKAVQGFDKSQLENRKGVAEASKAEAETFGKTMDAYKPLIASAQSADQARAIMAAQYKDPVLGPHLQAIGPLDSLLSKIPDDPTQFQGWKTQTVDGMSQYNTMIQQKADLAERQRHAGVEEKQGQQRIGIEGGQLGLARDRFNFEKSQSQGQVLPEQGVIVDRRTGKTMPILDANGQPVPPKDKALTESQGKAAAFASRARQSSDILDSVGQAGAVQPGNIKRFGAALPVVGDSLGTLLNGTQSAKQQQVEQAQRDFVNSVLRVESGASISPAEFKNAGMQYFPQPGDSPEVIAQKKRNRETEIQGLQQMAGPNAKMVGGGQTSTGKITSKGVDPSKLSDAELKRELGL